MNAFLAIQLLELSRVVTASVFGLSDIRVIERDDCERYFLPRIGDQFHVFEFLLVVVGKVDLAAMDFFRSQNKSTRLKLTIICQILFRNLQHASREIF